MTVSDRRRYLVLIVYSQPSHHTFGIRVDVPQVRVRGTWIVCMILREVYREAWEDWTSIRFYSIAFRSSATTIGRQGSQALEQ